VTKFRRDSLEKIYNGNMCRCFVVALTDQLFSLIQYIRLVSQTWLVYYWCLVYRRQFHIFGWFLMFSSSLFNTVLWEENMLISCVCMERGGEVVIRSLLYCSILQFHNSFLLEEFSLILVNEREDRIYFFLLLRRPTLGNWEYRRPECKDSN